MRRAPDLARYGNLPASHVIDREGGVFPYRRNPAGGAPAPKTADFIATPVACRPDRRLLSIYRVHRRGRAAAPFGVLAVGPRWLKAHRLGQPELQFRSCWRDESAGRNWDTVSRRGPAF